MWDQSYYYSDSNFQLDINLQTLRRLLIQAIDDFEAEDCSRCKRLKCCCDLPAISSDSGQDTDDQAPPSVPSDVISEDREFKHVGAWVRASTPNPGRTASGCKTIWPPAPQSVWKDYKRISKSEINVGMSQSNVEEFFKLFNVNVCDGKAFAQNRALMRTLKVMAGKSSEYQYF